VIAYSLISADPERKERTARLIADLIQQAGARQPTRSERNQARTARRRQLIGGLVAAGALA
jgi:hypothetical protein